MQFPVAARDLFHAGGAVLVLLMVLSVYSVGVILERWMAFRGFGKSVKDALHRLGQATRTGEMDKTLEAMRGGKNPAHDVFLRIFSTKGTLEERRGAVLLAIERQMIGLQTGIAPLGTIGSVAPFIGLFGTILGVMRAFRDLAAYQGAGPGVVAVGISEALVTTAAGLFVAIPAIVAYNYFSRRSQQIADDLAWIAEDLLERRA